MDESQVYRKEMGVLLDRVDGKFYVVSNYNAYEVNEIGARILDLCNGKNKISDIAYKLANHFDCEYDSVYADVEEYVEMLESQKIIGKC